MSNAWVPIPCAYSTSVGSEEASGADKPGELAELVAKGDYIRVIDCRYLFDQIIEAHRYVDGGHKKGSVAITMGIT